MGIVESFQQPETAFDQSLFDSRSFIVLVTLPHDLCTENRCCRRGCKYQDQEGCSRPAAFKPKQPTRESQEPEVYNKVVTRPICVKTNLEAVFVNCESVQLQ